MTDIVTAAKRSEMMAGIKSKNTRPEMVIRKALHKLGFRYLLHAKNIPGRPDIIFPKYNAVIFIQGCFWHGHNCKLFKWPSSRKEFWVNKITTNRQTDFRNFEKLNASKWRMGFIWECSIKGKDRLPLDEVVKKTTKWLMSDDKIFSIGSTS